MSEPTLMRSVCATLTQSYTPLQESSSIQAINKLFLKAFGKSLDIKVEQKFSFSNLSSENLSSEDLLKKRISVIDDIRSEIVILFQNLFPEDLEIVKNLNDSPYYFLSSQVVIKISQYLTKAFDLLTLSKFSPLIKAFQAAAKVGYLPIIHKILGFFIEKKVSNAWELLLKDALWTAVGNDEEEVFRLIINSPLAEETPLEETKFLGVLFISAVSQNRQTILITMLNSTFAKKLPQKGPYSLEKALEIATNKKHTKMIQIIKSYL